MQQHASHNSGFRKKQNFDKVKKQNVSEVTTAKVYENIKVMEDCRKGDQRTESGIFGKLPSQVNGKSDLVGIYHVEDPHNLNDLVPLKKLRKPLQ